VSDKDAALWEFRSPPSLAAAIAVGPASGASALHEEEAMLASWTHIGPSVVAAFLASLVEFVEALTVILAVGATRGWRGALTGAGAGLVVLLVLVAVLGPALTLIPLGLVQLAVGTLLLLFGMRWLRKAILRAAGIIPLHDEAAAFEAETAALRGLGQVSRGLDKVAFVAAFKITMLEGVEVVFIVIAVGAGGVGLLVPAALAALAALLVVVLLGLAIHRPLARVPENTLKFLVGVLLTAFGAFWVGEGLNVAWPGEDWAILGLVAGFGLVALLCVPWCRRLAMRSQATQAGAAS
jgi:uncharacterized membrane protein